MVHAETQKDAEVEDETLSLAHTKWVLMTIRAFGSLIFIPFRSSLTA